MTAVELRWGAHGNAPADHGYTLYSAISHRLSTAVHDDDAWAVAPVAGETLCIRCPLHLAPVFASVLTGADLRVAGDMLRLGSYPLLVPLEPRRSLESTGVTIKAGGAGTCDLSREAFKAALESRLGALGILAGAGIRYEVGERREGKIKGAPVVGYGVRFTGLPPAVSLRLQVEGVGGRRKMGWGWFA